jgi:poly(glycerol-phosphate) alpha-glucosyltransferase
MRHLQFSQSLEPLEGGGLGSSAVALHRQLRAAGVDSVLCSTCGKTPEKRAEATLEFPRLGPAPFYFAPGMAREARRLVRECDVIHGHGLYVGPNFLLGREARKQNKPLVYHTHGFFEPWILNRSRWKKRLAHWLFEDANFRHVRLWRALTSKEADQIRACGIGKPIVVAPNGIDVREFPSPIPPGAPIRTPWAGSLEKKGRRLLFLGRIHPKKGLDLLLPAWASLPGKRDWELIIAGPDEQGFLGALRDLARNFGLERSVTFTGPVTGPVKNSLLHSADVFVLPSYSEGFPMSVLEAMACGVPVLATTASNFPDITSAEAGWECEANLGSVREGLDKALNAPDDERWQRGTNGRRLVEHRYNWSSIVSELLAACAAHC